LSRVNWAAEGRLVEAAIILEDMAVGLFVESEQCVYKT